MTKYFAILSIICLAACSHPKPEAHSSDVAVKESLPVTDAPATPSAHEYVNTDGTWVLPTCSDATDSIALHNLNDRFGFTYAIDDEPELDRTSAELKRLKKWADALPEATEDEYCIKTGYLKWIRFYTGQANERSKYLNYLATHKVPTPPGYRWNR